MKHTSQKNLKRNRQKANIIVLIRQGKVKEAVEYAIKEGIDAVEFGKISKKA